MTCSTTATVWCVAQYNTGSDEPMGAMPVVGIFPTELDAYKALASFNASRMSSVYTYEVHCMNVLPYEEASAEDKQCVACGCVHTGEKDLCASCVAEEANEDAMHAMYERMCEDGDTMSHADAITGIH